MQIVFRLLRIMCLALASFGANVAFAQANLGELLDAGGKQMSKEEITSAVSGNTIVGPSLTGAINNTKYNPDGTYTGSGSSGGSNYGYFGTWTVDADGQACAVNGGGSNRGVKNCGYWFKASDQLFSCPSNTDRSAPVLKRTRQQ